MEAIQKDIEALDKNLWKWCAVLFKAGHELTCKLDDGEIITHFMKRGLAQGCYVEPHLPVDSAENRVHCRKKQMRNADPNARVNIYQGDLTLNGNTDLLAE